MSLFKPAGVPAREVQRVVLPLDCYEAIRLVDYEGMEQEAAAEVIGVSRPTVTRLLQKGRYIVSQALVNGWALAIEGGTVVERPLPPGSMPGMPGWGRGMGRGRGGCGRGGGGRGGGGKRFRGGRGPG